MTSSAELTARKLAQIPSISAFTAQYVSANTDGTVMVDFGEGPVQVYSAGFYTPLPGDSVRVIKLDTFTLMLGPLVQDPAYGRVTATGTPKLTVQYADGSTEMLFYMSSAYPSPAVNDDVKIDRASGGMILGKVTGVPVSGYLPPVAPTGPVSQSGAADFRAVDSGTWNTDGSFFNDDVWCSSTTVGAWFYGSIIADTIPDEATITLVRLYTPEFENRFPTSLATIGLHTSPSKGFPTVTGAVSIPNGADFKTLPNSFGDALKTGTAWGLGTNHGGYHRYTRRALSAQSGLLHIEWKV